MKFISILFLLFSLSSFAQALNNQGLAVILIDMQYGFYERGGVTGTEGLENLVANQVKLLDWAKQEGIPVLVFEYRNYKETDIRLIEAIEGNISKILTKNYDNGFTGISREEAIETLKQWKVDTVIVAGINGQYCVRGTAEGAMEAGFEVISSSEIVGNINQNPPIFPNDTWYFQGKKSFIVFNELLDIIQ